MYRTHDQQRARIMELLNHMTPPNSTAGKLHRLDSVEARLSTLEHNLQQFHAAIDRRSKETQQQALDLQNKINYQRLKEDEPEDNRPFLELEAEMNRESCLRRNTAIRNDKVIGEKFMGLLLELKADDQTLEGTETSLSNFIAKKLQGVEEGIREQTADREEEHRLARAGFEANADKLNQGVDAHRNGRLAFEGGVIEDLKKVMERLTDDLKQEEAIREDEEEQILNTLEIALEKFS